MKSGSEYIDHWRKRQYIRVKTKLFEMVDAYVKDPPQRILDIGCGFAKTSELFQKKYGSELYLLEGEPHPEANRRLGKWGDVATFNYYLPTETLKNAWDSQGMIYTFVNGQDPQIPEHIKFDLVYSWLSCGFHYPVSTYRDLILRHTNDASIIIMDFRSVKAIDFKTQGVEVIHELARDNKKRTLHVRFQ